MVLTTFRHVGLVVRDIETCKAFYKALGFDVLVDRDESSDFIHNLLGIETKSLRLVKLGRSPADAFIELLAFDTHVNSAQRPLNGVGITHFALTVENVDSFYDEHRGRCSFLTEPRVSPDGRVKVVFCRDPEGNVIEVVSIREPSKTG